MTTISPSVKRLVHESFMPVLLVVLAILLSLIYAEYVMVRDADAVTTIRIPRQMLQEQAVQEDLERPADAPLLSAEESGDSRLEQAGLLAAAGKWRDAEAIYLTILAEGPNSRAFNDLGVMHLDKGETQTALEYFNKALNSSPVYVRAYMNRALTYTRLNKISEAIRDYQSLVQKLPNHFESHYNMGLLYLSVRAYDQAVPAFERASNLAAGERKARAHFSLGRANAKLDRTQAAREAFEAAIRLKPDYVEPRLELAALEDDSPQGRARALARFDEVFRLRPDYPPAYFALARLYSGAGEPQRAIRAYQDAIKFNPEYRSAHYNLGLLLLAQKSYSAARAEFEWVLQRDPAHAESRFNLARAAYGAKDHTTALREYRAAIELRGGDYPEAYLNLGLVLAGLKQYAEAEASYQKALKLNGSYTEAWYNLGLLHLKQKQWLLAQSSLQNALEYDPGNAQAWFNLGVLAGREDKNDAAIDAYQRALKIRPDYSQARLNLAVRYARRERYPQAIAEYRRLLDQDDSYAVAWLNLGRAYLRTGAPAEAEEALRRSLELEPSSKRAMKVLAKALATQQKYGDAIDVTRQALAMDASDSKLRLSLAHLLEQVGKTEEARHELEKAQRLDPGSPVSSQAFNTLSAKPH